MAFFGITQLGYQNPFAAKTLSNVQEMAANQDVDGYVRVSSHGTVTVSLPHIQPLQHSADIHLGSQEKYKEMIKRVQSPRSPNEAYRAPLTDSQQYGWWAPGVEESEPWMRVKRFPRKNSEMTKFVKEMSMTDRGFSLF